MKRILVIACCFSYLLFSSCRQKTNQEALNKFCENQLTEWNNKLTLVIISDIFTPPVCSRIYAYTNIAAYEALRQGYKNYPSSAGKLNTLQKLPQPKTGAAYNYPIAGVIAF